MNFDFVAAIDVWFKGKERNQIPMFALTVTKPYRLTDAVYKSAFIFGVFFSVYWCLLFFLVY